MNALLRELGSSALGRRPENVFPGTSVTATNHARGKSELTDEERKQIEDLKARDQHAPLLEVAANESRARAEMVQPRKDDQAQRRTESPYSPTADTQFSTDSQHRRGLFVDLLV